MEVTCCKQYVVMFLPLLRCPTTYSACDHAPYENVYKPNLPYARDAVIEAIRQIITNFHPAMIALTGPDERHVDHRTANWFAIKACQELLKAKGARSPDHRAGRPGLRLGRLQTRPLQI